MKLINADTLADLLATGPANCGRFVAKLPQACQAIACSYSRKLNHTDPKPANVMVGSFGKVQSWTRESPRC